MARLTAAARNALPDSDFAGPNRTFPVEDATHARAALSLQRFGSSATKKNIKSKVSRKFPKIDVASPKMQALKNLANRK